MKVVLERIALPRVSELHPSIPLDAIGRGLAGTYADLLEAPLPEHISVLLIRLDESEPEHPET